MVPKGNHKGYPYRDNARQGMRKKRFCIEIPFTPVGAILHGCPWERKEIMVPKDNHKGYPYGNNAVME
jgi:hypothetical protein